MWSVLAILFAFAAGSIPVIAEIQTVGQPIFFPENQHSYLLLESSTWQDAEAKALELGGHLATIRNQTEQDWLFKTFSGGTTDSRSLWIGLQRLESGGAFRWVSGEPLLYSNWFAGNSVVGFAPEPNNAYGDENYGMMTRYGYSPWVPAGSWNDLRSPNIYFHDFDPVQGVAEVPGYVSSGPFRIAYSTNALNQGLISYPADPEYYYVLYQTPDLVNTWTPVAESLFTEPSADFPVATTNAEQFFLVLKISLFAPENVLRDGIDDVFKLQNGLDPLKLGVADQSSGHVDRYGNPLTWLAYYQQQFGRNLVGGEYYSRELSTFNFGLPTARLEAVSREISAYNGQPEPFGPEAQEVYSREVSAFNFGIPTAAIETISREVTVYNGQAPLAITPQEVYSPEVSGFNTGENPTQVSFISREISAFNFGLPTAPLEAISREVSIYNQ